MKLKNALLLALTAFIWGTAFVAQSVGMEYIGPFTFNGVRSIIGAITLVPCILIQKKSGRKIIEEGSNGKDLIAGGLLCGALLFVASSLQQIGIKYTSAGKAGFITSCYIVIVPLIGIFMKKTSGWKIWAAVVLALAGLYCLCITDGFTVGKGDIFIFLCAMAFSAHILVIDYFSPRVNGVVLSCIQFFVCGVASLPCMFVFETPDFICRCALLRCGVYVADYRAEECESDDSVTDIESGIVFFSACGMGYSS